MTGKRIQRMEPLAISATKMWPPGQSAQEERAPDNRMSSSTMRPTSPTVHQAERDARAELGKLIERPVAKQEYSGASSKTS